MDKGQHLRLVIMGGSSSSQTTNYVAAATDLTVHFSAQTEDSTTKDTTDTTGGWLEYEVTGRTGDIQFSALLYSVDAGQQAVAGSYYLSDFLNMMDDRIVDWKLLAVNGAQNRVKVKTICTGKGKLTNLQATGQNRQNATFSGTLNMYGPVTVGND